MSSQHQVGRTGSRSEAAKERLKTNSALIGSEKPAMGSELVSSKNRCSSYMRPNTQSQLQQTPTASSQTQRSPGQSQAPIQVLEIAYFTIESLGLVSFFIVRIFLGFFVAGLLLGTLGRLLLLFHPVYLTMIRTFIIGLVIGQCVIVLRLSLRRKFRWKVQECKTEPEMIKDPSRRRYDDTSRRCDIHTARQ